MSILLKRSAVDCEGRRMDNKNYMWCAQSPSYIITWGSLLFGQIVGKWDTSVLIGLSKCHRRPKGIMTSLKQKDHINVSMMKKIYNASQNIEFSSKREDCRCSIYCLRLQNISTLSGITAISIMIPWSTSSRLIWLV